jgi:hypothetical protein
MYNSMVFMKVVVPGNLAPTIIDVVEAKCHAYGNLYTERLPPKVHVLAFEKASSWEYDRVTK